MGGSATLVLIASLATTVAAQPREIAAADVATAPRPGTESGRADPIDPGDSLARKLGRVVLWIPRIPLEIVTLPIRGVLYFQSKRAAGEIKHGEDDPKFTLGFGPELVAQSGFLPHAGLRVRLSNLFRKHEQVGMRVGYGGHLGALVGVEGDTGHRLGPLKAGLEGRVDRRTQERFFGFGNATDAIATRYRLRSERAAAWLRATLPEHFAVIGRGMLVRKRFRSDSNPRGDDVALDQGYDPATITGYLDGARFVRAELEASWDTRHVASSYDPRSIRDSGALVLGYASHDWDLDGARNTTRYGFDLQQNIRLTAGPRVLELRLAGEAIASDLEHVPFTEVPSIGGDLLRAADTDRYRDRAALVMRTTYLFALGSKAAGVLFGEAGRVYHSVDDFTLAGLHYGGGIGIEGYSVTSLVLRADVAASFDGGVFFSVGLVPVSDGRSRVRD